MFTVWLGCTPEQLWAFAVDPSGQRGDTETEYLPTALSSTETDTSTSDNNLWMQGGRKDLEKKKETERENANYGDKRGPGIDKFNGYNLGDRKVI